MSGHTKLDPTLVNEIATTLLGESGHVPSSGFRSADERGYYGKTPAGSHLGDSYHRVQQLTLSDLRDCRDRMVAFHDALKAAVTDVERADDDVSVNFRVIGNADRGIF